jgi:hypothetical protein
LTYLFSWENAFDFVIKLWAGSSRAGVGNLFSAKGHLDIYNIIRGPYKIINLKIILLYLAKRLINSPLM